MFPHYWKKKQDGSLDDKGMLDEYSHIYPLYTGDVYRKACGSTLWLYLHPFHTLILVTPSIESFLITFTMNNFDSRKFDISDLESGFDHIQPVPSAKSGKRVLSERSEG